MRDWYTVARYPADGPEELSLVVTDAPWIPLVLEVFAEWACEKAGHRWCHIVGRIEEWVDRREGPGDHRSDYAKRVRSNQ